MSKSIAIDGSGQLVFPIGIPACAENDSSLRSYAVWTRSRQEKAASAMLDALDVLQYLPLKSEVRQWSDRRQIVETPIFGGYLFVRINLLKPSHMQVLKVPGEVGFVGNRTVRCLLPIGKSRIFAL